MRVIVHVAIKLVVRHWILMDAAPQDQVAPLQCLVQLLAQTPRDLVA